MAISYDDWKKSYTELDAAGKQKFVDLAKNSDVGKEYMQRYASEMNTTPKTSTTPTPTPTKTETTPTPTTTTTTTTGTTGTTPPTKTGGVNVEGIKNMWDNLSYEDQQKYLGQYKGLQESLTAKGITNKTKPTEGTPTTPTTTTTKGKDEWDYQDSSEGRLYEIAGHLNDYRTSQSYLFDNWDTFSNFFIDGKDRSQEQLNYLRDYFNAVKRYNSLDNMTADAVGNMLVNGAVPEDYLNYLKYSNPQRYAEVMDAKARETNKIKDSASMDTIKSMEGETDTTTSKAIEWLKEQGLFVDKDGNLIDDRTENYASDEEKTYLKQLADLAAANLDIDNIVKHTYDDYVEKYPGATKATLMAMAQDVNSDLLREKENNLVEMTRLQGYVGYMQDERKEKTDIAQKSIDNLQKQYGMYYEYDKEGMSELLNAQYEATSPSLSSVENGTDADKRRALDKILTDYYDKYSSIIERPKEQVINDVMNYAKEKGITLEQALKENFTDYLKAKPDYKALSSLSQGNKYKFASFEGADGVKHTVKYNEDTGQWEEIFGEEASDYDMGGTGGLNNFINNLISGGYKIASNGGTGGSKIREGWCGEPVNDYLKSIGDSTSYGNDKQDKLNSITPGAGPQIGAVAIWDKTGTEDGDKYGHVAIVTGINRDNGTITVLESNKNTGLRYKDYKLENVTGFHIPNKNALGYGEHPMSDMVNMLYNKGGLTDGQKKDLLFADQAYGVMYDLASSGDLDHLIKSEDGQKILTNLKSSKLIQNGENVIGPVIFDTLKNNITDQRNLNTINKLITLIELKLRKWSGAAINASEWISNFDLLVPQAGLDENVAKDKYVTFETRYLMPMYNAVGGGKKGYSYTPLFSENSPYYKTDTLEDKGRTKGGILIKNIDWSKYTGGTNGRYTTGDLETLWEENN